MPKEVTFDRIENYGRWIFGDFRPALHRTKDFEVGLFRIPKGEKSVPHFHEITQEWNLIISGSCLVYSAGIKHKLGEGDIFFFDKGVVSNVEYTSDTVLVVIKVPSNPSDKVIVTKKDNSDDEG